MAMALRSPQNNYISGSEDIYVSISQIKMLGLKTGDTVEGQMDHHAMLSATLQ